MKIIRYSELAFVREAIREKRDREAAPDSRVVVICPNCGTGKFKDLCGNKIEVVCDCGYGGYVEMFYKDIKDRVVVQPDGKTVLSVKRLVAIEAGRKPEGLHVPERFCRHPPPPLTAQK